MKKIIFSVFCMSFVMITSTSCQHRSTAAAAAADKSFSPSEVVVDNILARRSIRAYKPAVPSHDTLAVILDAAINAPSAMNKQPWEVRVVTNPALLEKIAAAGGHFYGAPVLVVVASDEKNHYAAYDCGLFSQNLMLAAEAFGLGTVALGSVPNALNKPESADLLAEMAFSPGYKTIIGIALGYKNQAPEAKPRDAGKVKYIE